MIESSEQAAKTITTRISQLFKPGVNQYLRIDVVNNRFTRQYNFFYDIRKKQTRERSIPLHSLTEYRLEYLESVVAQIQKQTQLTIRFSGFEGQRWPSDLHYIQKPIPNKTNPDLPF